MRVRWLLLLFVPILAVPARPQADAEINLLLSSSVAKQREEGVAALGKTQNTATAKRLLKFLEDPDWGVQMAAMRALAPIQFGPGRDGIRKMIFRGDTLALRTLAAEVLREHDRLTTAKKLKKAVFKYKKRARLPGIHALGILGTADGIVALKKLSKAGDPDHRAAACVALGVLKAGEKELFRCLKDRKLFVQHRAAIALAELDSDASRQTILAYVQKTDDPVSPYVLVRVGRAGVVTNRGAFEAALREQLASSSDPAPLLRIAIAARATGCEEAALKHARDKDPLVRAFVVRLVGMGTPADTDLLVKALGSKDGRVRYAAAEALLRVGKKDPDKTFSLLLNRKESDVVLIAVRAALDARHKGSVPRLVELAQGKGPAKKDWMLRCAACVAAGWVGGVEVFESLEKITANRDWRVRAAALEGLFRIYDKKSIPVLLKFFDDRHPAVKLAARKNLRFMTQKKYSRRNLFVKWWAKHSKTIELVHPEDAGERMKKGGYHVRRDMIEVLRKTDIVAVLGRWDRVQLILEDLKIRHHAVRAQEIKEMGLNPKQVVLVNCEGSTDSETSMYLKWFVITGGYMATTDWTIVNALHNTFPHVVEKYGRQSTGNDVVVAEEAAPGHPVLRDVFRPYVAPKWWLEIAAFPLEVRDPIRSTVLVDSFEMLTRYKRAALMVEFPYGLGKVMHSASHFYLQTEGLAKETSAKRRRIFAHDHLGMSLEEIRRLDAKNYFEDAKDTTPISKSYSMFHMLVNFIQEKRQIDLGK